MLNTLYIRTFLAVVDVGNYTAAAEQLHMSQPAVSQHIRALEEQLGGVRLFRRIGQRMVATHAGEELLASARELMTLAERIEQNIRALRGHVVGRVAIGCTPSSGEHLLPPLLAAFRERFPAVTLAIQIASGEVLFDALATQQVALLVIEEPQRRRGWEAHILGREVLRLLAPANHPLVEVAEVTPALLREQPLVLPCTGSPLRRTIEDGLRRRGVVVGEMQIAMECDSLSVVLRGVQAGLGLAFAPETWLSTATGLQCLRLPGAPLQQEWYILRARGRSLPPAAQEFYSFLTCPTALSILARCGLLLPDEA